MSDSMRQALKRSANCPDLALLFEAMEQAPADPRRLQAEEHLKTCSACQTEWSMFQQFEAAEVRPEERADVDFILREVRTRRAAQQEAEKSKGAPSFWERFWTPGWLGATALAMAALVMTIGLTTQWRARHGATDDGGDHQTFRSQSVEITTPLRDITQTPERIEWKAVQAAASYTILLTEVDGTRIFYTNVTSQSLSLPDDARKMLAQGKVLLLTITAADTSAREIARSGVVRIRVGRTDSK